MILNYLLLLLLFASTGSPLCADPTQPENLCTACVSNDILIDGTCYVKIRGCLRHSAGPVCIECQFGYVLANGTCIRQALYFNRTNITDIPPIQITPPETLTYEQIQAKLGVENTPNFSTAHQYFLLRYTIQLNKGNIKQVQQIQTKTGSFIIIIYENNIKIRYEAVAFFNIVNKFRQWSFNRVGQFRKNVWVADNYTKIVLADRIKNHLIYQINQNVDIITIDYINVTNITRAIINRNDLLSPQTLTTKLQVLSLTISDIGVQNVLSQYPQLYSYKITVIQKIDQFYIVSFGLTVSVSFKFANFRFSINAPVKISASVYSSSDLSFKNIYVNGFSIFTNYFQPQFIACGQYIAQLFPQTIGASISKVQSQNTNSITFKISMKKLISSTVLDQYQFVVWFNNSNLAYLIQGKKNGKVIYQDYYNYNIDSLFLSNYKIIQTTSRIANIPSISSVLYKQTNNKRYYKIIYTNKQFAQFQYLTDLNKANFISYYIDGQNILDVLSGQIVKKRSPGELLKYIKIKQITLNNSLVKQIVQTLPIYMVTIVSNSGTFKAQIQDKLGQLNMLQFVKIDNITCFQYNLNAPEISSQKIRAVDDVVRLNYPIDGFQVQLALVNVLLYTYNYRFIYANTKLKQIIVLLEQYNGFINIINIYFTNQGYQVLEPNQNNPDYQIISAILKYSDLAGNKIPFYTENNGSLTKAYYHDGKNTYQIYYNSLTNQAYSYIIAVRSYLLVPDGFSQQNLLLPGLPSALDNATLAGIVNLALNKYTFIINNSTLAFADKINDTYNLMFKSSYGYQKLQATMSNNIITLGKLIVTNYKDSDFSNCKRFDDQGRCLSCDIRNQIQYEGYCYKIIEGCMIQPGSICVKCKTNYIKQNQRCYKECVNLF